MLKYSGEARIRWIHRIIAQAWEQGYVPNDWAKAVIVPIHKKGNVKDCNNYRGISLLSVVGKLYAAIIDRRVRAIVETTLDESQCGFRPMRGCQDQIFCLRQISEKCYERNRDVYMCFVDLEKAYDRVPRDKLFEVLSEYRVQGQLLRAIKSMYRESRAAIRIDSRISSWFDVGNGVRQGCNLSPLLFIIYMDKIIKEADFQGGVHIGGSAVNSLAYADDLVILAESAEELQNNISALNRQSFSYGMKINVRKTQVMHIGRRRKDFQCTIGTEVLEQVKEFVYLGCIFSEDGSLTREFEERKRKGNIVCAQLRSAIFRKKEVSRQTKLSIYKAVYRPTILFGSESWVDSGSLVHNLEVADMRVVRMISGTSRWDQWQNGISNEEIREELGIHSVDEAGRRARLRWWGHLNRMSESREPKKILEADIAGRRSRGRPRRRWRDSVRSDLEIRGLELEEARILTGTRREWRKVVLGADPTL